MKKYIILLTVVFLISVNLKAQAFWNPFDYIHIETSSASSFNQYSEVKDAVNKLIEAYESRNINSFMNCVSENYADDNDILESKIRKTFSKYSFIQINYAINSIIADSKEKYAVSINYTKQIEDRTTDKIVSRKGTSTIIMKKENDEFKLYRVQNQKLF